MTADFADRPTVFPRTLAAGVVVLCCLAALLGGLTIHRDFVATTARTEANTRNMGRLLHQIVVSDIEEVDLALLAALDEMGREAANGGIREAELTAFLSRYQARLPQIVSLRATDEKGIVRYGPGVAAATLTDLSDREFFIRHRDQADAGLIIAKPVFARISKQWVVPVSRRIAKPDGGFGGVIYANIALDHLRGMFAQLDIGPHGTILLLDDGLRLIARQPTPTAQGPAIGQNFTSPSLQAFVGTDAPSATLRTTSAIDGLSRTYTYRRVAPYPLIVSVGLADRDALVEWRHHSLLTASITAGFLLITVLLSVALWRVWRHRGEAFLQLARAGDELKQALRDLKRSNSELESFAYAASHDLRQPLRMVTSFLGLIERRYGDKLDKEGREFIAYAVDGARRMDALILGLLDYSRIGRNAESVPVALAKAVNEALANLQPAIAEAKADIRVAPDLPTVSGSAMELMRLFQNLIGNAIKYRHPDRAPEIAIGLRPDRTSWIITVADNGMGIPAESTERIFGLFQRLASDGEGEGTGLGLAICRKIAEHHGGRIWVEPAESGSLFVVSLPKTPGSAG